MKRGHASSVALLDLDRPAPRAAAPRPARRSTSSPPPRTWPPIAREVGGDKVTVEALARGYQDPHFVEAKPSFILKLNQRDLLVVVGRELEIGWLPPLITQSRNAKIQPGADGYLDASLTAKSWTSRPGRSRGPWATCHPLGNPHYWLDPANGRRIAQAIAAKLSQQARRTRPTSRSASPTSTRLAEAEKRWKARWRPTRAQGRHLSPLLAELRRPLRPRRHRLRRAEAGHSAVAAAHARPHQGDEAPERQADPGRALLRPQDAELHRAADRRQVVVLPPSVGGVKESPTTSSCSTTTSTCWSPPSRRRRGAEVMDRSPSSCNSWPRRSWPA